MESFLDRINNNQYTLIKYFMNTTLQHFNICLPFNWPTSKLNKIKLYKSIEQLGNYCIYLKQIENSIHTLLSTFGSTLKHNYSHETNSGFSKCMPRLRTSEEHTGSQECQLLNSFPYRVLCGSFYTSGYFAHCHFALFPRDWRLAVLPCDIHFHTQIGLHRFPLCALQSNLPCWQL